MLSGCYGWPAKLDGMRPALAASLAVKIDIKTNARPVREKIELLCMRPSYYWLKKLGSFLAKSDSMEACL